MGCVDFGHAKRTSPTRVSQCTLFTMDNVTTLGIADNRPDKLVFGIKQTDRLQHIYLIGQSGTGKSTLLANLALQDAEQGNGFCLVDPHGDLAEALSARLQTEHIHWRLGDPNCTYGYNPLAKVPFALRPLVASGFVDTLKKQWSDSWGPRMEHLLRFSVLALLDQPDTNMTQIVRMYVDKDFRRAAIANIIDPQVRAFWTVELPRMNYLTSIDGVAPIANKLSAFLANPVIRRSLCDPAKPIRFRKAMDQGQIVIVNLAKGQTGTDNANVVGGLVVSNVMNAAFSRHGLPEHQRRPFFLYADEFHNFTTESISDMLSEARKYGLGLCASHQFTAQTETGILEAILGNVGTLISLRIGARDAPLIARQFASIEPRYFTSLPNHRGYIQLLVDGTKRPAFSFSTLPFPNDYEKPKNRIRYV